MSSITTEPNRVTPDEECRRIAEYRRLGFEHGAMPHVVYHDPHIICPWPGCGFAIAAIDFQLERYGDPASYKVYLVAWWQGPGLVGRCPSCANYVLFGMDAKQSVPDPTANSLAVLPDDWYQNAHVI